MEIFKRLTEIFIVNTNMIHSLKVAFIVTRICLFFLLKVILGNCKYNKVQRKTCTAYKKSFRRKLASSMCCTLYTVHTQRCFMYTHRETNM